MTTDFQLAFEAVPSPLLIVSDGVTRRCNRALCTLFGLPLSEIVGRAVDDLCTVPASAPQSRRIVAIQSGGTVCAVSVHKLDLGGARDRELWSFERLGSIDWSAKSLTPRQREIASHLLCGATSKQIAQRLGLSHRTVDSHRRHLMRRLNVSRVGHLWSVVRTTDGRSPMPHGSLVHDGHLPAFAQLNAP